MSRPYAPADVERGLLALADAGGSARLASETTGIPRSTLHQWKDQYAERYERIRADRLPEIYAEVGDEMVKLLRAQNEAEQELTVRMRQVTPELDARDVSTGLRNVAVSKGINVDKARLMHDRPTVITETRSAEELLDGMRRRGWIDGEAEEVTPAELEEGTRDEEQDNSS